MNCDEYWYVRSWDIRIICISIFIVLLTSKSFFISVHVTVNPLLITKVETMVLEVYTMILLNVPNGNCAITYEQSFVSL